MWALNMERGQQVFKHMALEAQQRKSGLVLASVEDTEGVSAEERANWWNDMLISTGQFPYYVNPDNTVVHSVEKDAKSKVLPGAVAVIPAHGTMVHDCWAIEEVFYGLVSSKRLAAFQRDALNDPKVVAVVQDIYSPGGQVNGTEALGRSTRALSAVKPTVAHVECLAASAGYWFASQCGTIVLDGETSEVGSVGVMLSFFDIIPFYESLGFKYHEIYAPESDKKNEGWRDLSTQKDPAKIKAELSATAQLFRNVVQQGRGTRLGTDASVLEGRVFAGSDAVRVGLADSIGDLASCIASVRTAKSTGNAAPAADPNKPDPNEAPGTGAASITPTPTANTDRPMKLKSVLASFAALFSAKEDATAENIAEANAELKEKGISNVHLVDSEAFAAAATAETRVSEAQAATTAMTTERDAAIAERDAARAELAGVNAGIQEAATQLGITAEGDASALATMTTAHQAAAADVTRLNGELTTAKTRITELEALGADDGKGAGALNQEGDLRGAGTIDPRLAAWNKGIEAEVKAMGNA